MEHYKKRIECQKGIPLITVVTLPGSGSEVNSEAVISNYRTKEKLTYSSSLIFPKISIIDPLVMESVSLDLWKYAVVDMFSHALEQYFVEYSSEINDSLLEALMKTVLEVSISLFYDFPNEAKIEELIWCSSLSDSLFMSRGNKESAYPIHTIEHELTARYGIVHGQGIAMLIPAWLEYVYMTTKSSRFIRFAKNVFGVEKNNCEACATEVLFRMKKFIKSLNLQTNLSSLMLSDIDLVSIAQNVVCSEDLSVAFPPLGSDEVIDVLRLALRD